MRINEIIKFPKKYKKSSVLGKTPDEKHLVYPDDMTGLPVVYNKQGYPFHVDPDTFELPDDYDENYTYPKEWYVVKRDTNALGFRQAYSIHHSYEEAELAARKLRQWQGKDVEVVPG